MAVTVDVITGNNATGAVSTVARTLTVGNNSNRVLVAMIFSGQPATPLTVSSVTGGGGASWVKLGAIVTGSTREFEIWSSIGPATGAQTVTVTFSGTIGSEDGGVVVYSLYGVDQTTPVDTYTTNTGTTLAITVASATGNLVIGEGIFNAATSGFSGTQDYTLSNFEEWRAGHDVGSASVTLTWTGTAGTGRGINACNVNAAVTGSTANVSLPNLGDGISKMIVTGFAA